MPRSTLGQRLAEAIARDSGIRDERLLGAFAAVPRERFLGPPPWMIARPAYDGAAGPAYTTTSDPAEVYANVSVALDASRHLFNGAPATVAAWLEALNPQAGETAFHAGCGTGYYTAILSILTGPAGSVTGVDLDESLIVQAGEALVDLPTASVVAKDATLFAVPGYDVGLVNMGVSVIPEPWLEQLNPHNGRIAIPLTVPLPGRGSESYLSKGMVFLIARSADAWAARVIGGAIIFSDSAEADREAQLRLLKSLMTGNAHGVKSLRRDLHDPDETCWLHERRYCLSARPAHS